MRLIGLISFFLIFISVHAADKDRNAIDSMRHFPELRSDIINTDVNDEEFLRNIARDTWKYFENSTYGKSGLVVDKILVDKKNAAHYTSITNIGLYMLCCISAEQLGFIDRNESLRLVTTSLNNLEKLRKFRGFFFNWYELDIMKPADEYISTVDAGWLLCSLDAVGEYFPELRDKCSGLSETADMSMLYSDSLGAFSLGYRINQGLSPYHYELLCSESRISFYYAVKHGYINVSNYFRLKRTLPGNIDQNQNPDGEWNEYKNIKYFNGFYRYDSLKFVPSWGGSAFESLMPGLIFSEKFAEKGLGLNNSVVVKIQMDYTLNKMKYPVWGMSPCALPGTGYGEFGVPTAGTKKGGYPAGVVTPHASVLALSYAPAEVIKNLKTLISGYPVYGEYGFYDSVVMDNNEVTHSYLALDQAMILISIANYLKSDIIPSLFMKGCKIEELKIIMANEKLF